MLASLGRGVLGTPLDSGRCFVTRILSLSRRQVTTSNMPIKVLNVAEKNDAAKNIAALISHGQSLRREGFSKFNKLYEFRCQVQGQNCDMTMTSVSGHLMGLDYGPHYRKWFSCQPSQLFDLPVEKKCPENMLPIKRTLEREAKKAQWLIVWTDCDREGENIGFEIIDVCRAVKPSLKIFRATFSEITLPSISRALENLGQPNLRVSQAVDVRQELDLRIGAAFTRFQTMRLQKKFPNKLANKLLSYGSCQFPTMGFVVERYKAIENFVPEAFWKIKVFHKIDDVNVEFHWKRLRLFDETAAQSYHDICLENPVAKVEECKSKPKSKWRPLPMDTVELEKLGARKLKLSAKVVMQAAEKLYTQGFISYPRTETNIFPKELNLRPLVEIQTRDQRWGGKLTAFVC